MKTSGTGYVDLEDSRIGTREIRIHDAIAKQKPKAKPLGRDRISGVPRGFFCPFIPKELQVAVPLFE